MTIREEFISEHSCRPATVKFSALCFRAEKGNSGRNSDTDQRQIQATTGGAGSPVVGGDGQINTGTTITGGYGSTTVNQTDGGAVDRAFTFGENVVDAVGKIFVNEAATQKDTVTANSDFLAAQTDLIASNSAGGATAAQNKTILYVVGAAILAVVAIIFLRR